MLRILLDSTPTLTYPLAGGNANSLSFKGEGWAEGKILGVPNISN
jgi:hypothetical protein